MDTIDYVNRDPHNINEQVASTTFLDVIAEPDGTHSFDCVWKGAFVCFECCKGFVYKFLTTILGVCIAAAWGFEFAILSFWHIWYVTPFAKTLEFNCSVLKKVYGLCVNCVIEPCCEAVGGMFVNFKH